MRVRFARPYITKTDIAAVVNSLKGRSRLTNSGNVQAFEFAFSEYTQGGVAIAVSSCTAALYMTLVALGIKAGDEVILPALSFAACGHVIEAIGAKPVFVDVDPDSGTIDPDLAEKAITKKTKAIMAMHYAGRVCFLGTLRDIARRNNIYLIEDCATALGAVHSGKHVGLHGDAGCFSFHPVKHITTGEGGMILTTNPELAERLKAIREFGRVNDPYKPISGNYQITGFGLNFRMTEMQGALGLSQLKMLSEILKRREDNLFVLRNLLSDFKVLDPEPGAYYALIVMIPEGIGQYGVRNEMMQRYVETSLYYPGPLPLMPYYAGKYGYFRGMFPASDKIAEHSVALSVGPHLNKEDMKYQADVFRSALRNKSRA